MAVLWELVLVGCLLCVTAGQVHVSVHLAENASLPCRSPAAGTISVLKWSRPDLNGAGYVFFYRHNRRLDSYQHPSFRGRVQLREPDMGDGDASLVLRNVSAGDAGTYECYVSLRDERRSRRALETSQFVTLSVTGETHRAAEKLEFIREEPEGDTQDAVTVETSTPLAVVVVVVVVVCVLGFVSLLTVMRHKQQKNVKDPPEAEEQSMVAET
ncbi:coxsackievirus and adenovirus receptor homolog [Stegastes partitus]|uniref:Coxsackievirus and adenovirus receptor homolog n=1 Tax=Stegastes partitus TaxID=144197 RepID=A0A9Y4U098_9TELE|nr:PREDICTED: coxsackievirus and adenovirus receptor homolog [Stegastes partitus]